MKKNDNPVHYQQETIPCTNCSKFSPERCPLCEGKGRFSPGWYFWDKTWSCSYGPFETEAEASEACTIDTKSP